MTGADLAQIQFIRFAGIIKKIRGKYSVPLLV